MKKKYLSKTRKRTTKKGKRKYKRTVRGKSIRKNKKRKAFLVGGDDDPFCDYKNNEKVWPINFGCELNETEKEITLPIGTIIDRFGHNYGYYFGDPSSSFDKRSLSLLKPGKSCEPLYIERMKDNSIAYNEYRVKKEFKVKTCTIAPAFNHTGHGIQYRLFEGSLGNVNNLLYPIKPKTNQSDANGNSINREMFVPNVQELIDNQYIALNNIGTIPSFE